MDRDWDGFGPSTYGDRMADVYDVRFSTLARETDAAVALLADLAGPGPIPDLAIGTGRVALPLAARGLEVRGIDASERMVAKLRDKGGGSAIPVTIGDFADVDVDGAFSLVYVVFNTFFALLSQEDQVRCFRNVADHLVPGGAFVIEAFVPDLARFDRGQRTETVRVGQDEVTLGASKHDPIGQRADSQHILVSEEGIRLFPVRIRYAWPSELDLMARVAGLRLRERWGDWDRRPYTDASAKHVSIFEKPLGG